MPRIVPAVAVAAALLTACSGSQGPLGADANAAWRFASGLTAS